MPTIRKATRGAEFLHGYGTVRGGDTVEVDADTVEYLVEQSGYEHVTDGDGADDAPGPDLTEAPEDMTYQELRDVASDLEISGRSDMNKDELVAAVSEAIE